MTKQGCPLEAVTPFGAISLQMYGHYQQGILLRAADDEGRPVALGGQPLWYVQAMDEVAAGIREAQAYVDREQRRMAERQTNQAAGFKGRPPARRRP